MYFTYNKHLLQIDLAIIKPWVDKKVIQYIGIEDEVV